MKISLGIMAWNEAEIIETSLKSLFEQSLLKRLPEWKATLEIIVVPNGCSDRTEEAARATLESLAAPYPPPDPLLEGKLAEAARKGQCLEPLHPPLRGSQR
jgi:hypothetical protein